ncbi:MAG: DUF58 domain-containing protein [Chloroflexota bacterium]|nr:MAG: DUF58 domain-containing protein [Chloroflexota bacterium]
MIPVTPVIIGIFLIASFFKIAFLYHVLYLLVAVVVVSRVWAHLAARAITVERRFESPALHGQEIDVVLAIRNRGWLPVPWLRTHDHLPLALATSANVDQVVSLGPRAERVMSFRTTGRQRGWYELGPVRIEVGDLFGFARHAIEFATKARLTVYPRIVPIGRRGLVSRLPFGAVRSRAALFDDPSRVIGAREYQPGDSLRSVHWSATAATGTLQVRKLEPAMTLRTVVAVDLSRDAYPAEFRFYASELAIVATASVVSHLIDLRQEVGLVVAGRDPMLPLGTNARALDAAKGNTQRERILSTLARVHLDDCPPIANALSAAAASFGWGTSLIVVVPAITAELIAILTRLRRSGVSASAILVRRTTPYGAIEESVPAWLSTIDVWRDDDLDTSEHGAVRSVPVRLGSN